VRATQRLQKFGYEAYLVGGCVRDLLLGRTAKDYDIATAARPQQVKRVFPRNCRIIGRRFKLAHLHFHGNTKILECSTFRQSPQASENGDDVLITRDNEFGTAEEDALRRDFTVNGLFLDPTRDTILDYTNGLQDVRDRVIRTIGDPHVRFREDPVRILRAAKFAGRLGFTVEPGTFQAMCDTSADLVRSAPPRLFEEILRLLRGGHSLDSFQLLRDVGAVRSLVPALADHLADAAHEERVDFWRLLQALDHRVQDGHVPPSGVLLGTLLVDAVLAKAARNPGRSPSSIAEELLGPFCAELRLPRRDAGCLKRICGVQHRFTQDDGEKRFRTEGFVHGPYFLEALDLFELRTLAAGGDLSVVDRWRDLADAAFHGGERGDTRPAYDDEDGSEAANGPRDPAGDDARPADDEGAAAHDAESAPASSEGRGDDEAPANPWAQPAEPGRRRRRRRRRGRRRGGPEGDEFAAGSPPEAVASPTPESSPGDDDDAPPSVRTPHVVHDFVHPEGADDSDLDAADGNVLASDEPTPDGATRLPAADDASQPDGEGGRRRRRRRRRRGRGGDAFRESPPPAPHGEAVDAEQPRHEPLRPVREQRDPEAPADGDIDGPHHTDETNEEARASSGEHHGEGAPPTSVDDAAPGHRSGRRRRRRGRGRGRSEGDDQPGRPAGDRQQQPQRQHPPERQHPPRQHQQQHQQRSGHRDRRRPHQDRPRDDRPRDVDVVPRFRDRRGKVDVIEPAALDLSAFDVELDPKRVPTFGSIVEGKGRPKRRGPRVPGDGVDDYKPPPPPGQSGGPAPPPPPPEGDTPDTFGDW
jgi:poly(A) polymerase